MNGYYAEQTCDLEDFKALTARETQGSDVPHAQDILHQIPVYDAPDLAPLLASPETRRNVMAEWADVLLNGAGVFALKRAQTNVAVIDRASDVFNAIIAQEKAQSGGGADHFAAAGSNDRIWNAQQKLCEAAPEIFAAYFASPALDAACEAWLGPAYQMTAQINLVHPGGQAQQAHRDYHLGFQTADVGAQFPAHVHALSPLMTLQGGLAHCDMGLDSGPTKFLPFSQLYQPGYMAWRRPDFRAHFEASYVQVPLQKGDAVFFNPALLHAAGENRTTDVHRMVNLFQVSSAFGRAMESLDRIAMCLAVFEPLQKAWQDGQIGVAERDAVIACTAEGYAFPTNLDRDPPVGGLAPESQQAVLRRFVCERGTKAALATQLYAQKQRQTAGQM